MRDDNQDKNRVLSSTAETAQKNNNERTSLNDAGKASDSKTNDKVSQPTQGNEKFTTGTINSNSKMQPNEKSKSILTNPSPTDISVQSAQNCVGQIVDSSNVHCLGPDGRQQPGTSGGQNCVGQIVNSKDVKCSTGNGTKGSQNCVGQIVNSMNTSCGSGSGSGSGTQGPPGSWSTRTCWS